MELLVHVKILFRLFFNLFFKLLLFFLLYNIVLVLPYINMPPPRLYTCAPSWTPLPPPSPYHPSGSSQCPSPKLPVSCIEPGLAIRFLYDIIHVLMPFDNLPNCFPSCCCYSVTKLCPTLRTRLPCLSLSSETCSNSCLLRIHHFIFPLSLNEGFNFSTCSPTLTISAFLKL